MTKTTKLRLPKSSLILLYLFAGLCLLASVSIAQVDETPWRLEPIWTIGSDDGDIFFTHVMLGELGADGTLYVRDAQDAFIRVFSSDGEELKQIGSKGQGPGEFGHITSILTVGDDRLFVADRQNGRISELDVDGSLRRTLKLAGATTLNNRIVGYDAPTDKLVVMYLYARTLEELKPLIHVIDIEKQRIKQSVGNPDDLVDLDDPIFNRVAGSLNTYREGSHLNEDGSYSLYITTHYYNGKLMTSTFEDGELTEPRILSVEPSFIPDHAAVLDLQDQQEMRDLLDSGQVKAASGHFGPRGTMYVEILSENWGVFSTGASTVGIGFNDLTGDNSRMFVDEFDLEKGHIGRHELTVGGEYPFESGRLIANNEGDELYFSHRTEDGVPVLSKMRLVKNPK